MESNRSSASISSSTSIREVVQVSDGVDSLLSLKRVRSDSSLTTTNSMSSRLGGMGLFTSDDADEEEEDDEQQTGVQSQLCADSQCGGDVAEEDEDEDERDDACAHQDRSLIVVKKHTTIGADGIQRFAIWYINGDRYFGEMLNEKRHGKGKYSCVESRSIYEGDWVENKKHGHGGLWENDLRKGYNEYTYAPRFVDGVKQPEETFKGEFLNDMFHGYGVKVFENGDGYEGGFANGLLQGQGEISYENGDKYVGGFLKGNFSGH
eukprot:gene39724-49090_t